jgi:alginate O-acetyltransferase complex protein AlgJ
MKQHWAASSFILLLAFFFWAGLPSLFSAASRISNADFVNGEWTDQYERQFSRDHMLYERSDRLWAQISYTAFEEGQSGVQIGQDSWLFSEEEFTYHKERTLFFEDRLDFIKQTAEKLNAHNIELVIALLPAKSRLYQSQLKAPYPSYNKEIYAKSLEYFKENDLIAPDLLTLLKNQEDTFFRTDTHWTNEGAQQVAEIISQTLQKRDLFSDNTNRYLLVKGDDVLFQGDLNRFLPHSAKYKEEKINLYKTVLQNANTDKRAALFVNISPPITLVGTSYSANPKWGFEAFLRAAFQQDVLNLAVEGLGPFEVMQDYFDNYLGQKNDTELIVWEIPERYLVMPLQQEEERSDSFI